MEIAAGYVLDSVLEEVLLDAGRRIKVFLTVPEPQLLVEVETPGVKLALVCDAGGMTATRRELDDTLASHGV